MNVGIVSSLLLSSEVLWKRAAYKMRSPIVDVLGFSPFTPGTLVPNGLLVGHAALDAVAALLLVLRRFGRSDL